MAKKNDFAVFIISHQRADQQLTLKSLEEANYNGRVYIIIDDQDKQMDLYKERFGEKVIVFDKEEMARATDTMDNFNNLASAVYARNFCFVLAKRLGVKYFLMVDDDIQHYQLRYDEQGSLKGKRVKDINKVLRCLVNFLKTNDNVVCVGFGNEGGFVGGVGGKFSQGVGRTCNQSMIVRADAPINYLGTQNEDFNICVEYGKIGKIFFEIYKTSIMSPKRNSNGGGIDYSKANNMYCSNFYSVVVAPNCCKIIQKGNDFVLRRKNDLFVPKIISGRWKK
jgi:hypothetical protein